jgi:hypothetical protein
MFKVSRVGSISVEKQMLFSLTVISVFCLLFVYMHPYLKTVSANGQASETDKTKTSLPTKVPSANQQQMNHLPIIAESDDSSGFLNSVNTVPPQNVSISNSSSSSGVGSSSSPQAGKQAGSYNPQTSSVISQDLDTLHINVPKVPSAVNKLL